MSLRLLGATRSPGDSLEVYKLLDVHAVEGFEWSPQVRSFTPGRLE